MQTTEQQTVDDRVHIGAYVDPTLKRELDESARRADRSLSAEIRLALRRHVDREQTTDSSSRESGR
jgi:predicted transcriptional regulator